jgi:hypothetical protein
LRRLRRPWAPARRHRFVHDQRIILIVVAIVAKTQEAWLEHASAIFDDLFRGLDGIGVVVLLLRRL